MARRTDLRFTHRIDPVDLLGALIRAGKSSFGFMFEPDEDTAFMAVTPERLFKVDDNKIESEAVSGTIATGDNAPGGSAIGEALLSDEKNSREHGYVLDYLFERLGQICESVDEPSERTLLELATVSHIHSRLSGRLMAGYPTGTLVSHLHPTPAVCGVPTERALQLIRELEPFVRGWYAGPVGLVGRDFSEMAVAIRSALVSRRQVSLFAGAGIVHGSDARDEWTELEHKTMPALNVLSGVEM